MTAEFCCALPRLADIRLWPSEVTVRQARKIAAQLGGSLEDQGGIFPIGKNGP
jgi:hypothetical protein